MRALAAKASPATFQVRKIMDKNHRDTEGYPPSFSAEPAESDVLGLPPVSDLGPLPMWYIQLAFDKWSEAITGGRSDILQSSHGKAFLAGWLAREKYKEPRVWG